MAALSIRLVLPDNFKLVHGKWLKQYFGLFLNRGVLFVHPNTPFCLAQNKSKFSFSEYR